MALYEDESMVLRNPGEEPPEGFVYKGQMGPEGQVQDYYERPRATKGMSRNEIEGITPVQGQQSGMPMGGSLNQFLDWAVKNKLGFNPFTMNPTTEAMNKWNSMESNAFQQVFGNSGMSPSNMTPDALRHWNEQKKMAMGMLVDEATNKQKMGIAYLNMLKEGWDEQQKQSAERRTVTGNVTVDPATGEQVYTNKFGEIIQNPNIEQQRPTAQPPKAVAQPQMAEAEPAKPKSTGIVKPKTAKEPKQLSQESINQLAEMATTYDRLVDIGKKMAKRPDLAGPIQGRLNMLKVKYKNEGETQAVINELKSLITIAYALSGKQISEKEMKILQEAMLPSLSQPHSNLMATISFARDWLAQSHNKRLEYQTASGYTHGIKPLMVGENNEPQELPTGWTRDANGNVFNDKGKKMKWRD